MFSLPVSPDELIENYEHYIINNIKNRCDKNNHREFMDIEKLIECLCYVGYYSQGNLISRGYKTNITYIPGSIDYEGCGHFYTCAWLNHQGGCSNYENRPKMCTDYIKCEYRDCESFSCSIHSLNKENSVTNTIESFQNLLETYKNLYPENREFVESLMHIKIDKPKISFDPIGEYNRLVSSVNKEGK
jgi:hypothetical protein